MKRATYVGPIPHLQGETALIRKIEDGGVLAQFDNIGLTLDGKGVPKVLDYEPHARFPTWQTPDRPPDMCLGFGWHEFAESDFTVAVEDNESEGESDAISSE